MQTGPAIQLSQLPMQNSSHRGWGWGQTVFCFSFFFWFSAINLHIPSGDVGGETLDMLPVNHRGLQIIERQPVRLKTLSWIAEVGNAVLWLPLQAFCFYCIHSHLNKKKISDVMNDLANIYVYILHAFHWWLLLLYYWGHYVPALKSNICSQSICLSCLCYI